MKIEPEQPKLPGWDFLIVFDKKYNDQKRPEEPEIPGVDFIVAFHKKRNTFPNYSSEGEGGSSLE